MAFAVVLDRLFELGFVFGGFGGGKVWVGFYVAQIMRIDGFGTRFIGKRRECCFCLN